MRHTNALRQPAKQVVMDRAALLKLCDPQIATRYANPCAMAAELFCSTADVIGPPVIDPDIGQGHKMGDWRPVANVSHSVKMTSCPDPAL